MFLTVSHSLSACSEPRFPNSPPPIPEPTWFQKHKFRLLALSSFVGVGLVAFAISVLATHCLKEKIKREGRKNPHSNKAVRKPPSYLRHSFLISSALTRMMTETLGRAFQFAYHTEIFPGCTLQANPSRENRDLQRIKARMACSQREELVISLTEPHENQKSWVINPITQKEFEAQGVRYLNIPTTDVLPLNDDTFYRSVTEMRAVILKGGHVTAHCKAGVGRSASIVMAYLMCYGPVRNRLQPMTYKEAKKFCTAKRRQAMNKGQIQAIQTWVANNKRNLLTGREECL